MSVPGKREHRERKSAAQTGERHRRGHHRLTRLEYAAYSLPNMRCRVGSSYKTTKR